MGLTLAIIMRELTGWPRQKRFYLKRLAFVVTASGLVLLGVARQESFGASVLGLEIFRSLALLAVLVGCFAAAKRRCGPWGCC